jgi:hypothetical protein
MLSEAQLCCLLIACAYNVFHWETARYRVTVQGNRSGFGLGIHKTNRLLISRLQAKPPHNKFTKCLDSKEKDWKREKTQ